MSFRLFAVLSLAVLFAACSGSETVTAPESEPEPPMRATGPAFGVLTAFGGGVTARNLREDTARRLADLSGAMSLHDTAPGGRAWALVEAGTDSTRLWAYWLDQGLVLAHTAPNPVTYTTAWAPDGSELAFGFYRPTTAQSRPAMGAGDIRIASVSGVRRVGCSASRAVLAWMEGDGLLVRNTDNLYVVGRDGCDTRSTVDARRMHDLSASPDGSLIAYVHRELEYNRSSRSYVADSTFRIAASDGSDVRTVVNFRYHPEGFSWHPDGDELAYDVAVPDAGSQRAISIYDVAGGSSAFLHPPTPGGTSESEPLWSPDGAHIAYRQDTGLAVRSFVERFPAVIPDSEDAEMLGWVGYNALLYQTPGGVRVFDVAASEATALPVGTVVAWSMD